VKLWREAMRGWPLAIVVLLLVSGLLLAQPLAHGAGSSHSYIFNAAWTLEFGDALGRGQLPPRWLYGGFHGLGAPSFYYYPPLAVYVTSLVRALSGGDHAEVLAWASYVLTAASGLTMFAWLRNKTGDVWALVGAVELMARRLVTTLEEYDQPDVRALADELFSRSEAAMRDAIRTLPEGIYRYGFDTDGLAEPFRFELTLTIRDGAITADYAGSSPQQPRAINCPLTYTNAMTAYAVKCALLPNLPNNEGMFRPVTVTAPAGSILNPTPPVAVGGRMASGHYVPMLVFGALYQIAPERVMAAPGSPLWAVTLAGRRQGRNFATVLFFNGGFGARPDKDGVSCLSWPSNISSTPVEVAERNNPIFFRYKRLREGSGGDGQYRGGLGQDVAIDIESNDDIAALFVVERTKIAAPGLGGGTAGGLGFVTINGTTIDNRRPQFVRGGDRIVLGTPGGGGFGSANLRSTADRERDRKMGYVEL
jgi:N-methylhydantoinase B